MASNISHGPFAGSVAASAVVLPPLKRIEGLRDSKKVPEREREKPFRDLFCRCLDLGVGIVESDVIDKINILRATERAMDVAVRDLSMKSDVLPVDALKLPSLNIRHIPLVKREARSASIAAASIIAKVVRDRIMQRYDGLCPGYGFAAHKGYPMREHIGRATVIGTCLVHRKSFEHVMPPNLPYGCGG